MTEDINKSNLFYFLKLLKVNYILLFIFLSLGMISGYFLHYFSYKTIILEKTLYPLRTTDNIIHDHFDSEQILYEFIEISRENITKEEFNEIFEIREAGNDFMIPSKTFFGWEKTIINISYDDYLDMTGNKKYVKHRIDYQTNTFIASDIIKVRPNDSDIEIKKKKLKTEFIKYLEITNEILRYRLFNFIIAKNIASVDGDQIKFYPLKITIRGLNMPNIRYSIIGKDIKVYLLICALVSFAIGFVCLILRDLFKKIN